MFTHNTHLLSNSIFSTFFFNTTNSETKFVSIDPNLFLFSVISLIERFSYLYFSLQRETKKNFEAHYFLCEKLTPVFCRPWVTAILFRYHIYWILNV